MAQSGIFNILPTDYQLYLESMLPGMNEVPIGSEYFDEEMTDQITDSVLSNYFGTNSEAFDWARGTQDIGKYEGSIGEMDYITPRYSEGHNDPERLTGFNKLFNTLGSYNYKINPPGLEQQAIGHYKAATDPSVTITDRYDWNPDYGWRSDNKFGWKGPDSISSRGDVTTSMLAKKLWNQRKGNFDLSNTAEMVGNYFGHRQSEGEGRDVNMTIPISNETWQSYQPNSVPENTMRGSDLPTTDFSQWNKSTPSRVSNYTTPDRGDYGGRGHHFNTGGLVSLVL